MYNDTAKITALGVHSLHGSDLLSIILMFYLKLSVSVMLLFISRTLMVQ